VLIRRLAQENQGWGAPKIHAARHAYPHYAPHSTALNRKSKSAATRSDLLLKLDAFKLQFLGQGL
jgi:hypothetical protein